MPKTSILFGLLAALGTATATADVVINELSATNGGRTLRWDDNDQPYAGAGLAWWSNAFDDSAWDTGATPIGYSLGAIATDLGAQLRNASPSFYTRKTFTASAGDAASGQPLDLIISYNDGFIAWVNGVEVARANTGVAKTPVYHDQLAYRSNGSSTSTQTFELGVASELLFAGENTLCIQINNQTLGDDQTPIDNMRLDMALEIDNSGGADTTLVAAGSTVRYLPGLREPTSDVVEPALLSGPDADDDPSDWIELHNDGGAAVQLTGWTLTDDDTQPAKWTFPAGTSIAPGGYLLVLCDDPDAPIPGAAFLHSSFKLGAGGEFVGLYDAGGNMVDSIAPEYPKQYPNYSYARTPAGVFAYHGSPTPAAANAGATFTHRADAPDFDNKGGFYASTVDVTLTSETPGVTIRYTTDGTEPTATGGTVYTAPLSLARIDGRRGHVIRARSFGPGMIPSNTKTHTFLIGADARVLGSPTLAIAGDPTRTLYDPFGVLAIGGGTYSNNQWQPSGIADYNNLINRGRAYERAAHAEFYFPDGSVGFRTDVGLRAAASSFSRPRMQLNQLGSVPWPASGVQKPSFNLYFRDDYGNPSVTLPLNGPDRPVNTYERFRLRAGKNDIKNPFVIDELVRRLQRDMGHGASIGVLNTLYVNGDLKGFYNTVERLREPLFRSLHSADANAQWDVLQFEGNDNIAEGDKVAWNDMISRLNAAETLPNWESVLEVADVTNMADYYLLNIFTATWDWPHNNWVAAKERSPAGRYRLYVWDAEGGFNNKGDRPVSQEMINTYILGTQIGTGRSGQDGELRDLWRGLNRWEEFRTLFADRINKHLFNGGVLDDRDYANSHIKAEFDVLVDEFTPLLNLMNGESVQTSKPASWASPTNGRRRYLFGPTREEFRDNDLWPTAEPPQFSQFGGSVPEGAAMAITNVAGEIYYTTDGTDPRLPGGGANPSATSQPGSTQMLTLIPFAGSWNYSDAQGDLGTAWRQPGFDDAAWATGNSPFGYGNVTGVTIATQVSVEPRQPIYYLRKTFEIDDAEAFIDLTLSCYSDAGIVVYLNGQEFYRDSNIPAGAGYGADLDGDGNEGDLDVFTGDALQLVDGTNVIAIELHNEITSSDAAGDIQLDAVRTSPDSPPVTITEPVTIMARTLEGGVWSALTVADFTIETTPADSSNTAVTELLYNPAGPDASEQAAGYDDGDQFEFLRIENTSAGAIDLHGVRFTDGITFDYSTSALRSLPPGGAALIVSDIDAFRARYGTGHDDIIAGSYSGKLNNGGENVRLIGAAGNAIHEFDYATSAPWPTLGAPDGQSIQIIDPAADHADGANWQASGNTGGSLSGALTFATWAATQFSAAQLADPAVSGPGADPDGDGWGNFLEFALGTPPLSAANGVPAPRASVEISGGDAFLVLEYTRHPGERAATITAQISDDLIVWTAGGAEVPPPTVNPDGTITVRFAHPVPVGAAGGSQFLRLSASE